MLRHTDVLHQVTETQLDVLWVVERDSWYFENYAAFHGEIEQFVRHFDYTGLDWHMGVTSASGSEYYSGRLGSYASQRWVSNTTVNAPNAFSEMLYDIPMSTGDDNAIFDAVMNTTTRNAEWLNDGFYRQDGYLSLVIVTDSDTRVYGTQLPEFVSWLERRRGSLDKVKIWLIAGDAETPCLWGADDWQVAQPAPLLHELVERVGGGVHSLCDADISPLLDQVGLDASSFPTEFYLTHVPFEGSLEVVVSFEHEPDRFPGALTVYRMDEAADDPKRRFSYCPKTNSVVFEHFMPPPRATIEISYDVRGTGDEPSPPEGDTGFDG